MINQQWVCFISFIIIHALCLCCVQGKKFKPHDRVDIQEYIKMTSVLVQYIVENQRSEIDILIIVSFGRSNCQHVQISISLLFLASQRQRPARWMLLQLKSL